MEEVKGSITEVQALPEARRCLQCGSICYDHEKVLEPGNKSWFGRHLNGILL